MRLVVVSDLHVASGPLDDCDPSIEADLVRFCSSLEAAGDPVELVINGDFLDFVQADPWQSRELEAVAADGTPLCFTEAQSVQKLDHIIAAHPGMFDAFARLLASRDLRRLTILPGNHDVDFYWAGVQAAFSKRLCETQPEVAAKLRFQLDEPYRPPEFPDIWIEHGHQRDDCNKFEIAGVPRWSAAAPPILPDKQGTPRLLECVGTRFMMKFLNNLDVQYPFVDNVKPFSKFVRMFLVSSVAPGFGPLKAIAAFWALLGFVAGRLGKSRSDLLSEERPRDMAVRSMKGAMANLPNSVDTLLTRCLQEAGFQLGGMPAGFFARHDDKNIARLLDFLVDHPALLDEVERDDSGMMGGGTPGYMTLGAGFLADETAVLRDAAATIIGSGAASGVVMGHTHEPVARPGLNYINVGCWTRYFRETADAPKTRSWELLKSTAYASFPYELAYAEATSAGGAVLSRRVFA
jgi:UDP-2,3-diacylglucosamine pyrophosphatase LpxH